jgi:uroporphyrin-III C-methyltransferase
VALASAAPPRWLVIGAALLAALAAGAGVLAWNTQQRLKALESELVRRQQGSDGTASEARALARQAEGASREVVAKMALLEARVAENAMQRSQFEDLIQSLARSRDENVLADVEAAIRVAMQQSAITGSAEPLIQVLRQADERLARYSQPRLDRVRRAVVQDLERTRAAGVADIGALALRLDDAVRAVDELPLLSRPERRLGAGPGSASSVALSAPPSAAAASAAPPAGAGSAPAWAQALGDSGAYIGQRIWAEVRSLVRVTRIDHPEAMLVAPEQAFFLRENLKLRLLNARLALLSRQFDTAQSDLRDAQSALERYFDRNARRTQGVAEALRQVQAQARTVTVPRPDATLAAIATASAGR